LLLQTLSGLFMPGYQATEIILNTELILMKTTEFESDTMLSASHLHRFTDTAAPPERRGAFAV